MIDNDILTVLHCAGGVKSPPCESCLYNNYSYPDCQRHAVIDALDLIRKQQAEFDNIKNDLKYYLDTNEENGVVYIPKFVVEKLIGKGI